MRGETKGEARSVVVYCVSKGRGRKGGVAFLCKYDYSTFTHYLVGYERANKGGGREKKQEEEKKRRPLM